MESKVGVTEERISHSAQSIDQCFPANISEADSSISVDEQPLAKVFSLSIPSIFPATISESDKYSSASDERLPKFCPSIESIFPATSTQTNSPANDEIITYHPIEIESCFPPRCDSDSDSLIPYDMNIINRFLRSYSIQSFFPPRKSSTSVSSVDSDSSFNFVSYLNEQILEKPKLKEFTFADLKTATSNFKLNGVLGEGDFGRVFKGWMDEKTLSPSKVGTGMIVAIKKFNPRRERHKEWVTEVNFLGVVEHSNIVKLVGYCAEDDERGTHRLLVYEYLPNGSVQDHLYTRSGTPLPWDMRLRIAQDTARSLTYLHEEMDFQIIFRDVKPSNILLDEQWNVKLSNFGLARLAPPEGLTNVSTVVVGTFGYAAPEYIQTGHLTSKCDVWSYGVFLYELITGRRPFDRNRPKSEQKLLEWVKPFLSNKKKFHLILDPRLEGKYPLKSAQKLAVVANRCLVRKPKNRPKMSEVLEMVNRIINDSTEMGTPQLPNLT